MSLDVLFGIGMLTTRLLHILAGVVLCVLGYRLFLQVATTNTHRGSGTLRDAEIAPACVGHRNHALTHAWDDPRRMLFRKGSTTAAAG